MASGKGTLLALALFVILLISGGALLSTTEGLSFFNAMYVTFLTITTVGSAYTPTSEGGKVVIMGIILLGMGTVFYLLTTVAAALIEGRLTLLFAGFKGGLVWMKNEKNHIIICGYGKTGKYAAETLRKQKIKYVIIENDPDKVKHLIEKKESVIQGDALNPALLEKANIKKAKAIAACLPDDSDNLYLVMTASDLNPNLIISAKARDEEAVSRLHKVGAQIVVLPEIVGGRQLADTILEVEKSNNLSTISTGKEKQKENKASIEIKKH